MNIYICRPVGVWAFQFDSVRFENPSGAKWSEAKSETKRKRIEAKRSESENEAKSEASRCEAIDEAREIRLGGPGLVPGGPRESRGSRVGGSPPCTYPTTMGP